jgi:hypothetical protein
LQSSGFGAWWWWWWWGFANQWCNTAALTQPTTMAFASWLVFAMYSSWYLGKKGVL